MYVRVLNIDIPRHSYFYNFYPALHFVDQYNVEAVGGEWSGQWSCIVNNYSTRAHWIWDDR